MLKFQFITKIYTWFKDVLFPFDSGWPPLGTKIKSTCWQQKHLQAMHTAAAASPALRPGHVAPSHWTFSHPGHCRLSIRQTFCEPPCLFHTQLRPFLQEPPAHFSPGQILLSVFDMGLPSASVGITSCGDYPTLLKAFLS